MVPASTATAIAARIGQCSLTLRIAVSIADRVRIEAMDRSKSPVVIGISTPSVSTAMTAWLPRMFARFAEVRNSLGRSAPNSAITAAHASSSP